MHILDAEVIILSDIIKMNYCTSIFLELIFLSKSTIVHLKNNNSVDNTVIMMS